MFCSSGNAVSKKWSTLHCMSPSAIADGAPCRPKDQLQTWRTQLSGQECRSKHHFVCKRAPLLPSSPSNCSKRSRPIHAERGVKEAVAPVHWPHSRTKKHARCSTVCSAAGGATRRSNIKVVVVGVGSEMGREVVRAVQKARGMEIVGAVDKGCTGEDIGEVAGLEALELPVLNDIVMVLSSVSQARDEVGVVVDVSGTSTAYETVRQATAFGLRSVVWAQGLTPKQLTTLIEFCNKSFMGCVAAPSFSIGEVLLQQAVVSAGFYYGDVDIGEKVDPDAQEVPSASVLRTAEALKGLGREYNFSEEGPTSDAETSDLLERTDVGEGLTIESRGLGTSAIKYSQEVCFRGTGETLEIKHTVQTAGGYMPGLLLAIRKVVRLRTMVYGLEKIL